MFRFGNRKYSTRTGTYQVWICKSNGANPEKLTDFDASDTSTPSWSPDGKWIAFNSNPDSNYDIYIMDAGGGPAKRLTRDIFSDLEPRWSRDGQWIYFWSNRTGRPEAWKVPVQGGEAVQVTANGGLTAEESPDGKFLYFVKSEIIQGIGTLWKQPIEGGEETLVLDSVNKASWTLTDTGIYALNMNTEPPSLQFLDFATSKLTKVAIITVEPRIAGARYLSISPDENWFLVVGNRAEVDIMLVENFR